MRARQKHMTAAHAEHAPGTLARAEEMYCVERKSFRETAKAVGASESAVRRWAAGHGWAAKREELAAMAASIRADGIRSRAHMLKKLLASEDSKEAVQLSYAVSCLERAALAAEDAAARREARGRGADPERNDPPRLDPIPESEGERIALLEEAVNRQLAFVLHSPVADLAARVRDIKAAMDVLRALRSANAAGEAAATVTVRFLEAD